MQKHEAHHGFIITVRWLIKSSMLASPRDFRPYSIHVTISELFTPFVAMTVALDNLLSSVNPNPNLSFRRDSMALSSTTFRVELLLRPRSYRAAVVSRCFSPKGLATRFVSLDRRSLRSQSIVAFAASQEDSKHSEIEIENAKSEVEMRADESGEAWKQSLESFKEQALKMKSVSQEAYELYSKKAMVILKETSVRLKIDAEKASENLSKIAKEISEESKEYLTAAAENSPEEVKDIVETFASSSDDIKEIHRIRDFYLGIPYGLLLSLGGFLSFILTGSISAIRFGVIPGGTLLALSVSSLRSWKRGESSAFALKGQAAISGIMFLRMMYLLSQRPSFPGFFLALISGAMVAFYIYRIMLNSGDKMKGHGSSLEHGTQN